MCIEGWRKGTGEEAIFKSYYEMSLVSSALLNCWYRMSKPILNDQTGKWSGRKGMRVIGILKEVLGKLE